MKMITKKTSGTRKAMDVLLFICLGLVSANAAETRQRLADGWGYVATFVIMAGNNCSLNLANKNPKLVTELRALFEKERTRSKE